MSQYPYVHQSVDLLEILPQLATGARCAVWTCIGLFEADPLGASKRDILDYTGLSRPTVERALRFLEINELVSFDPATKRYRCARYYRFGASEPVDVRELVPLVRGERAGTPACKKVFSQRARRSSVQPGPVGDKTAATTTAAQKILQAAGWYSVARDLPRFDDEAHARALARLIRENPMRADDPASYVRSCVMLNREWGKPPAAKRWWGDEQDEFVER